MKGKALFNIRLINVLLALVIGLFIVFPEISRITSDNLRSSSRNEWVRYPGPPHRRGEFQQNPPFSFKKEFDPFQDEEMAVVFYKRLAKDFIFFFLLSLCLMFFNTRSILLRRFSELYKVRTILISFLGTMAICALFVAAYTLLDYKLDFHPVIGGFNLFKSLFVSILSFLFGYLVQLFFYQQKIRLENERLKTESIQAQYNMLTAQVNPHFFFNSLNSLSALIREHQYDSSLKYINELSDIFRYVLNSGKKGLVTVKDELLFLQAYRYMLEIRYENKLEFKIEVPDNYLNYRLPCLSLQPLIENVIKHNALSEEAPLTVHLFVTDQKELVVKNRLQPKYDSLDEMGGIGLYNLNNRYKLLLSESISIEKSETDFSVKLPLTDPLT